MKTIHLYMAICLIAFSGVVNADRIEYLRQGDWRQGDWRQGDWRQGDWRQGDWRQGDWRQGDWRQGDWRQGDWRQEDWRQGDWRQEDLIQEYWRQSPWMQEDWIQEDLIGIQKESVQLLMDDPNFKKKYMNLYFKGKVNPSYPTNDEIDLFREGAKATCGNPCPITGACTNSELMFKKKECECPKTGACTK